MVPIFPPELVDIAYANLSEAKSIAAVISRLLFGIPAKNFHHKCTSGISIIELNRTEYCNTNTEQVIMFFLVTFYKIGVISDDHY
ncbi:hypothetical protein T4D_7622 [Trichinella pseudospiralis]|uniref:Uncharacterized protein n=1 Tax=Trichinella pseudospiralis TaxID=6337 RepID=A0A0V1FS61_TRIPS|nr:hypothetical protein T4D_7622 [Trichinella pseudospiralis]